MSRRPPILAVLALGAGLPVFSAGDAGELLSARIAAAVNGGTLARTGPAEWKRNDRITLHLVVEARAAGEEGSVFYTDVLALEIDGEPVDPARVRSWPGDPPEIRWHEVVNRAQRDTPGARWDAFEDLEIEGTRDRWRIDVRPSPAERRPGLPPGVGTGRYAVEVRTAGGTILRSPDAAAMNGRHAGGGGVFRVTLRRDNSLAGWITAFWNVPYKHPVTWDEVEDFAAISGPSLALGAYRAWTGADLPAFEELVLDRAPWRTFLERVQERVSGSAGPFHDPEGRSMDWGEARTMVRAGDLLTARGRIAILWADSGPRGKPNGHLDPDDLVAVADGAPPQIVPLSQAVPQPFSIVRFRDFTFLQVQLRTLSYYRGKNTAIFDAATQDALRRFQTEQGIPVTGLPDQTTLVAILRAVRETARE